MSFPEVTDQSLQRKDNYVHAPLAQNKSIGGNTTFTGLILLYFW